MKTRTVEAMKNSELLEPFLAIRTEREYDAAVERLNALVTKSATLRETRVIA